MIAERRGHRRYKLKCAVHLHHAGRIINAETDDLTPEGFHCTSEEPLSPGDCLECQISIPAGQPGEERRGLVIHGRVRVLRVEVCGLEPGFGIACEFEDRRLRS